MSKKTDLQKLKKDFAEKEKKLKSEVPIIQIEKKSNKKVVESRAPTIKGVERKHIEEERIKRLLGVVLHKPDEWKDIMAKISNKSKYSIAEQLNSLTQSKRSEFIKEYLQQNKPIRDFYKDWDLIEKEKLKNQEETPPLQGYKHSGVDFVKAETSRKRKRQERLKLKHQDRKDDEQKRSLDFWKNKADQLSREHIRAEQNVKKTIKPFVATETDKKKREDELKELIRIGAIKDDYYEVDKLYKNRRIPKPLPRVDSPQGFEKDRFTPKPVIISKESSGDTSVFNFAKDFLSLEIEQFAKKNSIQLEPERLSKNIVNFLNKNIGYVSDESDEKLTDKQKRKKFRKFQEVIKRTFNVETFFLPIAEIVLYLHSKDPQVIQRLKNILERTTVLSVLFDEKAKVNYINEKIQLALGSTDSDDKLEMFKKIQQIIEYMILLYNTPDSRERKRIPLLPEFDVDKELFKYRLGNVENRIAALPKDKKEDVKIVRKKGAPVWQIIMKSIHDIQNANGLAITEVDNAGHIKDGKESKSESKSQSKTRSKSQSKSKSEEKKDSPDNFGLKNYNSSEDSDYIQGSSDESIPEDYESDDPEDTESENEEETNEETNEDTDSESSESGSESESDNESDNESESESDSKTKSKKRSFSFSDGLKCEECDSSDVKFKSTLFKHREPYILGFCCVRCMEKYSFPDEGEKRRKR